MSDRKILRTAWYSTLQGMVGVCAVTTSPGGHWGALIAPLRPLSGNTEHEDAEYTMRWGAKMLKPIGCAQFPELPAELYGFPQ